MKMKLFVVSAIAALIATTNVFADTNSNAPANNPQSVTAPNANGDPQATSIDQNGMAQAQAPTTNPTQVPAQPQTTN